MIYGFRAHPNPIVIFEIQDLDVMIIDRFIHKITAAHICVVDWIN